MIFIRKKQEDPNMDDIFYDYYFVRPDLTPISITKQTLIDKYPEQRPTYNFLKDVYDFPTS